jgi:hypothetical protein
MLKYCLKLSIFFKKIKWKIVCSLRKCCRNQEFSEKKLCASSKFNLSLKHFDLKKKFARLPLFLSTKNPKNQRSIWCGLIYLFYFFYILINLFLEKNYKFCLVVGLTWLLIIFVLYIKFEGKDFLNTCLHAFTWSYRENAQQCMSRNG